MSHYEAWGIWEQGQSPTSMIAPRLTRTMFSMSAAKITSLLSEVPLVIRTSLGTS